jgi:prolyl-tRNA editing enzyme YbaK/EbsC (Cys-tRNA(Pro) deacylase)
LNQYDRKLYDYIVQKGIEAEHLVFEKSCHSVQEAAEAVNASPKDLVKNICLMDDEGNLIVAIVKGEHRVSTTKVGQALNIAPPRTATVEEILEKTGYPCGGVPSFSYEAMYLVDKKVMEKDFIYTGGGSEYSLVRISPSELVKANGARVVRIRK